MKIGKRYKVTAKIKTHTKPLCELIYEKIGTFVKETKAFYVFDNFRVNKANVLHIHEVLV